MSQAPLAHQDSGACDAISPISQTETAAGRVNRAVPMLLQVSGRRLRARRALDHVVTEQKWCRGRDSNPDGGLTPRDFKSGQEEGTTDREGHK